MSTDTITTGTLLKALAGLGPSADPDFPIRLGVYAGDLVLFDGKPWRYCSAELLASFHIVPTVQYLTPPPYEGSSGRHGRRRTWLTQHELDTQAHGHDFYTDGVPASEYAKVTKARAFTAQEIGYLRQWMGYARVKEHNPDPVIAMWRFLWTHPTIKLRKAWQKEFFCDI